MLTGLVTSTARAAGGLCLLMIVLSGSAAADDPDFDYDIYLHNDTIMLWIDITPALTQSKMEDLVSGLDITVGIDVDVVRPRKLVFSRTIASADAVIAVSRSLTRDTYRLLAAGSIDLSRTFKNQLILSDFLADSLEIPITAAETLRGLDIHLNISLLSKTHSNNTVDGLSGLAESPESGARDADGQFFESLFSAFLELVGFGTDSYRITTPEFSVDDLSAF